MVLGALRRFHPMDWKTLDWSCAAGAADDARGGRRSGSGNQGWSVPIWGPHGEFAMFKRERHSTTDPDLGALHRSPTPRTCCLISHLVHQHAKRIIDNQVELTSTEPIQCNLLIQNEKTASIKGNGEDVPSVFPSH